MNHRSGKMNHQEQLDNALDKLALLSKCRLYNPDCYGDTGFRMAKDSSLAIYYCCNPHDPNKIWIVGDAATGYRASLAFSTVEDAVDYFALKIGGINNVKN